MDASGSGSDASDEQWDSPAEHGETSSSEECSSEEDEPCSDEEAEKVAVLRYLHAPSASEVFKKKPGRKRGVKLEPCATAIDTEVIYRSVHPPSTRAQSNGAVRRCRGRGLGVHPLHT